MCNLSLQTYENGSALPFCEGTCSACLELGWTVALTLLNSVVCILNILHFIILSRLPCYNKLHYYKTILRVICMTDIALALLFTTLVSCSMRQFIHLSGRLAGAAFSIYGNSIALMRFFLLGLLGLERYVAVCKPFPYEQSTLLSYTKVLLTLLFPVLVVVLTIRDCLLHDELCLDYAWGPTLFKESYQGALLTAIMIVPPVLCVTVCSTKVLITLCQLNVKGQEQWNQFYIAIRYIVVNNLIYMVCLLPLMFHIVLAALDIDSEVFLWISLVSFMLYGGFNTVMYGWVMSIYRSEVKKLLCSLFQLN